MCSRGDEKPADEAGNIFDAHRSRRRCARVDRDKSIEPFGSSGECSNGAATNPAVIAHQQKHPRHRFRPAANLSMAALVKRRIVSGECVRERNRLSECERQTIARDRIYRSRRIADQCDAIADYPIEH